MSYQRGDKFVITNASFDIEITGFFPASQNKEGVDMYMATLNGESMKIKQSFLDGLVSLSKKEEIKTEEKIEIEKPKKLGKKSKEK